tara:strand:+ start:4540 stop:6786 length:2247 start_codon:yes stop_codon:yes gene_type:complete
MNRILYLLLCCIIYLFSFTTVSISEIVKDINISGNKRISDETILMFSDVKIGDEINDNDINIILKKLYETNFFENISIDYLDNILLIKTIEAPLIQNLEIKGVKAKKYEELIKNNLNLKAKSSFNKSILTQEIELIKSLLRVQGYYFVKVETYVEELDNNLINLEYRVDIGNKSKISKISFIGDKIYKNKKLKSIIISEEYKFWKFISGKKYLQEQLINLDKRLLTNFYLNKGFYNAVVNSSFAKMINDNEFELIYNINPGKKIFFGDLNVILPDDFDNTNYINLDKLLKKLKDKPYSINSVDKILNEIDKITTEEEYQTVKASSNEVIKDNKLNIDFIIEEADKYFVEKINIYGNNITIESVIRNQLDIDEGDPFSDLLTKKSENNIKSLNFFKEVNTTVKDGNKINSKIIDIEIKEKPTGEIMAGAGAGTDGGSVFFGVKENNYLGRGYGINTNATLSADTFKGEFGFNNPNYKNSDKLVFATFQLIEIDKLKNFGYKTNKNGFEVGTAFEYYEDFSLGLSTSNFFEEIETDSTASASQKKQAGNYFDSFLKFDFTLDKRNQKFKTDDGYYSSYDLSLPVVSDNNTLTNTYNYKIFTDLYENNISSFSLLLSSASSLTNDDIKLSERLFVPSNKLRGFEKGKIGPKEGGDFIGGNYLTTMNLQSTLPILFANSQNLDSVIFLDAANVWGVDYNSSIGDGSKIRSSIGFGVDWLTPIGPLSITLSQAITKKSSDIEETFRFNLGTTF